MKAICFVLLLAAAICINNEAKEKVTKFLSKNLQAMLHLNMAPYEYLLCHEVEDSRMDYTPEECYEMTVAQDTGRNCCWMYSNMTATITGQDEPITQAASTCVQIRNDPKLINAVKKVLSAIPSYYPDEYQIKINDLQIKCPSKR